MFKILSIDGGGVRGIQSAHVLQAIEEIHGKPISQLFDLIVGTSSGGLIALGLTCPNAANKPKYSAKDLVEIYISNAPIIFKKNWFRALFTGNGLWYVKYNRKRLDQVLNAFFSNVTLAQALCPVVIPTYSLIKSKPNFYNSTIESKNNTGLLMQDVAGATCSTPTYFSPKVFTDKAGNHHAGVDGGIYVNNPESVAVTTAIKMQPSLSRESILLVSIGNDNVPIRRTAKELKDSGLVGWVIRGQLIDMMINANTSWESNHISIIYPNTKRLQIPMPNALGEIDDSSKNNFNALQKLADEFIAENRQALKDLFL